MLIVMRSEANQNRGTRSLPPVHDAPQPTALPARTPGVRELPPDGGFPEAGREASDVAGSLLPILPDAVIGLDAPGRVTHWNTAAERTYGISAADAIGRPMAELVETVFLDSDLAAARRQLHVQGRWHGSVRQVSRGGLVVEVDSTVAALYDRSGGTRGLLAVNRVLDPDSAADTGDLTHRATHDPLTGLPNRAALLQRLGEALARLDSGRTPVGPGGKPLLAVLFCDLDGFKDINDGLGHAVGDQVLVAVAQRLRRRCRSADVVARFGGDEFVVVMAVDAIADAVATGNRIIEMLDSPITVGEVEVAPGVSVGITVVDAPPEGGDPVAAVLRDADTAMYHAKGRGRGRIELFDADLRDDAEEQLELATALRRAVGEGELELVYQTRRRCSDRRIRGVEALLRWRHPELGILGPQAFLPIAERTGRITELGEWVLRRSLAELAELPDPPSSEHGQISLAVNVSAKQLAGSRLTRTVARALEESGVAPQRLVLEVTETAFAENPGPAREALCELKSLGVTIALDDFGTGWSSLQYLRGLPVDMLKVDRSFVAELTTDPGAGAVIASVLGLGHGLGRVVVAEGVEDEATLAALRAMGCDEYQGFLDGTPSSLSTVLRDVAW